MEDVVFHSHLFLFPLKSAQGGTAAIDFQQKASILEVSTKQTQPFFQSLSESRSALLGFLETTDTTEDTVNSALTSYLSRLNHLLIPSANVDVEAGTSADASDLNNLFRFEWRSALQDISGGPNVVASSDVRYEIVSVLLSVSLWKARKGATCTKSDGSRPTAAEISQAYKLYQEAAGIVNHTLKVIPHLTDCPALDCNRSILEGLSRALLAEAESLTVLRAVAKGSSPSLVAALALDVHELYESASGMQTPAETCSKKFIAYLRYKSECFKAYALVFHAHTRLEAMAGGEAVRLAQESQKVFEEARRSGDVYDSYDPMTASELRSAFQSDLEIAISQVNAKAEKDNNGVYLQQVPDILPEMPDSKRLVKAEEFLFPPPESSISRDVFSKVDWKKSSDGRPATGFEVVEGKRADAGKTEGGQESPTKQQSAWWRWLLVFLTVPLLAAVTIVGVVVWIILLPVKLFCCPIGCAAQILWDVVEWLIKAPLRATLWASGEPWKPQKATEKEAIADKAGS